MTQGILPPTLDVLLKNSDFWLRDLRLGRYHEVIRGLPDAKYLGARVRSLFQTKRLLGYLAGRLGLGATGSVDELQERVTGSEGIGAYVLAATFALGKAPSAVVDVAEATLGADELGASRDRTGRYDRQLLILRLFDRSPQALAHVRGLDAWHRHGSAEVVLGRQPCEPRVPLADFLTCENVEAATATVQRPEGVPPVRFEMTVSRPGEGVIVFLRRNLRRTHHWSDDGTEIAHGHNEELIMLQFLDEGRRVRLAAVTARLPRQLADAIATAWLGEHCQYVEDLSPAHPAAVRRMVTALLGREVDQVRLVELAVRNAPLAGAPELVLRAPDGDRDIAEAVGQFEATAGPLLDRLDDVLYVKVAYGDRRVVLDFLGKGGAPVVRFSDGRMPKRDAQAFRKLVATQFGVPVHPGETACA